MRFLLKLLINTVAVYVTASVVPGIKIDSWITALIASIVLGVLNTLIKPLLVILTLPVNILTLGLFTIVINAFMITLTSSLVSGFHVETFVSAVLFSIVLSIVGGFLGLLAI
jgi:putative membrane protein